MTRFAKLRPGGLVALAASATVWATLVGAQDPAPAPVVIPKDAIERATAQIITALLERNHISKPTINDEVSRRWEKNFIEALDPLKYHFLKSDVEEFEKSADQLDDQIKEGDLTFARQVFARFLERSDERKTAALAILEAKPDFTIDESIPDDPKLVAYPATTEEANERLRKFIKRDLLAFKVGDVDEAEATRRLTVRFKDLNRYYHNFNSGDLLELYLTEMATAIDPHSSYMQPSTFEDMNQQLHLSLDGIGASLQVEDGFPVIKELIPHGPADKDGRLMPEDRIVGLVTDDGQKEDFFGKKLTDVVRKIRGPAGTKVNLLVKPAGSEEIKTYELTRAHVSLEESRAKEQILEVNGADGKPVKIGVINLPSFYGDLEAVATDGDKAVSATNDCRRILANFKSKGVEAVVIDLRMNGGGLLQEAITLSGLFIDKGPVVQVRDAIGVNHLDDDDEGTAWDGPLAVLIDHASASASEIFAGVIRDYGRGLVLGDSSTYGKGTVQSLVPLDRLRGLAGTNLGALKLTIQQFYRANGESTQVKGVPPHVHLPSFMDNQEIGEGKSETALKFDQVAPVPHQDYGLVPDSLVQALVKRSEERRSADEKFKDQARAIERYLARKARHEISLNEKTFREEMAANEVDQEEAKAKKTDKSKPKQRIAEHPAWESNFYNDEILKIVADYASLGRGVMTAGTTSHEAPDELQKPLRP
jgi:carboxyl-terminal processing protease